MHGTRLRIATVFTLLVAACGPTERAAPDASGSAGTCTAGEQRCTDNTFEQCSGGAWQVAEVCADQCSSTLGCVLCQPGSATCDGDTSRVCKADGSGYEEVLCDPEQGMVCGSGGRCETPCAPSTLGESYIGCDYWPTVTGNVVATGYDFAVAISNAADVATKVTIDGGALTSPEVFNVAAGSVVVKTLPWVPALKLCMGDGQLAQSCVKTSFDGALAVGGAYHLRSDRPVTVYQFNPLQYTKPGAPEPSTSNDASLLFPSTAWRKDHYVVTFPAYAGSTVVNPSFFAVTAQQDGTQVTITTTETTQAAGGAPAFTKGVPKTVVLNAGDVLELIVAPGDLSGSRVESDAPVQVIGGHYCANVPTTTPIPTPACDHLEEVVPPVETLGSEYVVISPAVTTIPEGKEQVVTILAVEEGVTTLSYDPPQPTFPTSIPGPGQWVTIERQAANYLLRASQKVLVAQFMEGQGAGGGTGDPSMTVAVPVEQFRREYLFHAPTNYETNYVDVVAPVGASVVLDGTPVSSWQSLGASGWALARVTPLDAGPAGDGNHVITSNEPFGVSVYGYGQATSYWYPGGLDLKRVVID